jgi:hypothetical protein
MSHSVGRVAPTIEAAGDNKSIFRLKALRSYSHRDVQSASYTLASPRSLYLLWALLALVVFLGVITWLSEIPVYTSAVAVALDAQASQDEQTASDMIAVFLPADRLNKLRVGQNVVIKLTNSKGAPHRLTAKIFAVEPEVLSPQAAQKRFDLGVPSSNISEPKAVALARLVPPASSAFLLNYRGGSIDAWVQTDSKPVVSLFPLMGRVIQLPDEREAIGSIACPGLARVSHVRKGEFFERHPVRALSCLLWEKSLQVKLKKQNEGGSLYV